MSKIISRWCAQRGLEATPSAVLGYQAVVVDTVRVRLGESSSGAIVVESQIAALPLSEREKDAMVDKAMRLAVGRMRHSQARLVSDPEATMLTLQTVLPGTSSDERLSQAVEDLVNEVEKWRKAF